MVGDKMKLTNSKKLLVIIILLSSILGTTNVLAQNNPGHDSLYVESNGSSNITGTLGIMDSNNSYANGTLYLGNYNGAQGSLRFDTSEGTDGKFVFSKPILVPGASPAITFYDLNDPTNTAKYKSIVYDANNAQLSTGDAIITNFGSGDGAPPTGKTLVQLGNIELSGQDATGTFLGINTP